MQTRCLNMSRFPFIMTHDILTHPQSDVGIFAKYLHMAKEAETNLICTLLQTDTLPFFVLLL